MALEACISGPPFGGLYHLCSEVLWVRDSTLIHPSDFDELAWSKRCRPIAAIEHFQVFNQMYSHVKKKILEHGL